MMFAVPTESLDDLVKPGSEKLWASLLKKWFVTDQNDKTPGIY